MFYLKLAAIKILGFVISQSLLFIIWIYLIVLKYYQKGDHGFMGSWVPPDSTHRP